MRIENTLLITTIVILSLCGCGFDSTITNIQSVEESDTTETGTIEPTPTPFVASLVVSKIAVGTEATSAIWNDGKTYAWGSNHDSDDIVSGLLGVGNSESTHYLDLATDMNVNPAFVSVAAGEVHSCGLTSLGRVYCWGKYTGDGTGLVRNTPSLVNDASSEYVQISTGSYHACGVTKSGVAKCWGDGWDGKLGNQNTSVQDSPIIADPGTLYKKIEAGRNHTCGITSQDKLKCWGANSNSQLGVASPSSSIIPIEIDSTESYKEISLGDDTTCAITTSGILKCWGANTNGQVGNNTTVKQTTPAVIDSGETYLKVSVGSNWNYHSCAITTSNKLKCWGNNTYGQIGDNSTTQRLTPVPVNAAVNYKEISVNNASSCAITSDDDFHCWGKNNRGQATGAAGNVLTPRDVQ